MIRTRTIREAAAYFREADPHTSLTETAIRTLLRTGAVPSARVGRKYLVTDMDKTTKSNCETDC